MLPEGDLLDDLDPVDAHLGHRFAQQSTGLETFKNDAAAADFIEKILAEHRRTGAARRAFIRQRSTFAVKGTLGDE